MNNDKTNFTSTPYTKEAYDKMNRYMPYCKKVN